MNGGSPAANGEPARDTYSPPASVAEANRSSRMMFVGRRSRHHRQLDRVWRVVNTLHRLLVIAELYEEDVAVIVRAPVLLS